MLGMFVGGHFGSGGLRFRADEPWKKIYGPLFVYVNGGNPSTRRGRMPRNVLRPRWEMAVRVAGTQDYPLERGTVAGAIQLTDGGSTKDAWVILSPPGEDWTQVLKGYDFWTWADAEGRFKLAKVRPGKYTLRVIGGDQFEEFRKDDVTVEAGKDADLGELEWEPIKHGRRLWQIGVADRSSHEFKGGDDFRHYDNFARYAKAFPEDVTFVVGKSKEAEDWNFAQWSALQQAPGLDDPVRPARQPAEGKGDFDDRLYLGQSAEGPDHEPGGEGQRQAGRGCSTCPRRARPATAAAVRTAPITSQPSHSTRGC